VRRRHHDTCGGSWVGERLLVAGHPGVEDGLAEGLPRAVRRRGSAAVLEDAGRATGPVRGGASERCGRRRRAGGRSGAGGSRSGSVGSAGAGRRAGRAGPCGQVRARRRDLRWTVGSSARKPLVAAAAQVPVDEHQSRRGRRPCRPARRPRAHVATSRRAGRGRAGPRARRAAVAVHRSQPAARWARSCTAIAVEPVVGVGGPDEQPGDGRQDAGRPRTWAGAAAAAGRPGDAAGCASRAASAA
jgi:hypothetical protein